MNHTHLRILAVCAALAAPTLTSDPAHAQQAQAQVVDANVLARQRQLFDQANKAYDAGRLPEAEGAYLQAWKLKKSFDVAGNLGNLEADLKKWAKAAELLAYAIREFPAGGKPALRENLLKRMAEAQQHVGALRIQVNRPGAEVWVDGVSVGTAPLGSEIFVDPGNHLVEARLEGFPTVQVSVPATRGKTDDVNVNLVAKGANRTVIIAGAVVAGLSAVMGGVFTGLWAGKGASAKDLAAKVPKNAPCPVGGTGATGNCADLASALRSQATFGSVAVGTFAAAGAVGIATVIYAVAGSRSSRTALTIAPTVTAQGGGLFVGGSF